jgi:hypothetical protein
VYTDGSLYSIYASEACWGWLTTVLLVDRFVAPEVILSARNYPATLEKHTLDKKVDVYAYAVTLWEIATRNAAYGDDGLGQLKCSPKPRTNKASELYDDVLQGVRPPLPVDEYGDGFCTLLKDCWHQDPEERPVFEKILVWPR